MAMSIATRNNENPLKLKHLVAQLTDVTEGIQEIVIGPKRLEDSGVQCDNAFGCHACKDEYESQSSSRGDIWIKSTSFKEISPSLLLAKNDKSTSTETLNLNLNPTFSNVSIWSSATFDSQSTCETLVKRIPKADSPRKTYHLQQSVLHDHRRGSRCPTVGCTNIFPHDESVCQKRYDGALLSPRNDTSQLPMPPKISKAALAKARSEAAAEEEKEMELVEVLEVARTPRARSRGFISQPSLITPRYGTPPATAPPNSTAKESLSPKTSARENRRKMNTHDLLYAAPSPVSPR